MNYLAVICALLQVGIAAVLACGVYRSMRERNRIAAALYTVWRAVFAWFLPGVLR